MDDGIIDLSAERNRRAQPDAAHIRHDEYGRPVYEFLLGYSSGGASYVLTIWAYDQAEAMARIEGIRESLYYQGQLFGMIEP